MPTSRPSLSLFAFVAVAAGTLALSACSSSDTPAPVQTVVVTASPSDGPSPVASAIAESVAEATADAKESLADATADAKDALEDAKDAAMFTMPDVVGMNLQDAQDLLQTFDSYVLDQEDASDQGRLQLNDSNWTVCTQDPAAGEVTKISDVVTLSSVKLDESCAS